MSERIYKGIIWLAVAGILIFTPLAQGAVKIQFITPVMLIMFLLLFIWLWRLNNHQGNKFIGTALDKPLFFFAILALISFIFSIYKQESFYALVKVIGYLCFYYFIVNNFDDAMIKRTLVLIIGIGAALSIYGLMQYFHVLPQPLRIPDKFLVATYVNHNHFSGYLELVIPLAIVSLLSEDERPLISRVILLLSLLAMIIAFIFAQSRGGWICLTVALVILVIILFKRKTSAKKNIFILLLLLSLLSFSAYFNRADIAQRLDTMASMETEGASWQTRLKIWQGSIKMIKQRPLIGTGIGTFVWGFPRFRPEGLNVQANFAHNDYLDIAAEMGIFAPLLVIWMLVIASRRVLLKQNYSLDILGCFIGALSLIFHGLVDFNFHIPANMLLFTVYAAFIMKKSYSQKERD